MIEDAVVTGHDRDAIGLLVFASLSGCRALCPHLPARRAAVGAHRREAACARRWRRAWRATTKRPAAVRTASPARFSSPIRPSIDTGEITDKGYINQRAVLTSRAALLARLYADPPPPEVIVIEG